MDLPCEPAGHGEIATGSVSSCSPFWRTFVRSLVVIQWIEHSYRLLWTSEAPRQRELRNAPSALEHHEFVTTDGHEWEPDVATGHGGAQEIELGRVRGRDLLEIIGSSGS